MSRIPVTNSPCHHSSTLPTNTSVFVIFSAGAAIDVKRNVILRLLLRLHHNLIPNLLALVTLRRRISFSLACSPLLGRSLLVVLPGRRGLALSC